MDRRCFLTTGALAIGALALPSCARSLSLEPIVPPAFPSLGNEPFHFATGIENSYPLLPNGRRIDQMEKCGHYTRWREDFGLLRELGIRTLRYGPAYYRTNPAPGRYDWSGVDDQMEWLRANGVTVIADLCHFGVPDWLDGFQDPALPAQLAAYSGAFARRYPWVRHYTPVNEILIAATFSSLHGWWNEGLTGDEDFGRTLLNICRANELAVEAILAERPDAIFLQTEPLSRYTPADASADAARHARFWSDIRFAPIDLVLGRTPSPPVQRLLERGGMTRADRAFFRRPRARGRRWLGLDYYLTCEQVVHSDGRCETAPTRAGLATLAREYHARYGIPLFIAETNRADHFAVEWLAEQWRDTQQLRAEGIPVVGFTWYALTDVVDWRHALREERGDVDQTGLCDLDRRVRAVGRAYAELVAGATATA